MIDLVPCVRVRRFRFLAAALLAFSLIAPVSMQGIQFVQSASTASAGPLSFPAANTGGNTIVVAVASGNAPTSVTDSQSNAYSLVPGSSLGVIRVYIANNVKSGVNSVTVNGITTWADVYIHEYAGLNTTSPVDQVSTASGTGTAITTGSKTTTSSNELIFGFAVAGSAVSTVGSGFTLRQTADGNGTYDAIVSSVGNYSAPATQVRSSSYTAAMVTLVAAIPNSPPAAPTNLSASAGNAQVTLGWTASGTATSYNVKRSISSGGPYSLVANTTSTSFTDSSVTNGTTYFYVVTAVNAAGESGNSNQASATPQASTQAIRYVQSASTSSAGPISFAAPNTNGDTILVAVVSGNAPTSVTDSQSNLYQLVPGSSLGMVRVYLASNVKPGSNTIMVNGITTWADTYIHEYAGLSLAAPVDQVSAASGTGKSITTGSKTTTSPNELIFGFAFDGSAISSVGPGFTLRETADANGSYDKVVSTTGTYSAPATQVRSSSYTAVMITLMAQSSGSPPPPPAPPTNLSTSTGNGQVSLSWTASASATSYNVKRSTTSGGPYTLVGSPSSTSFTNTGLTNGTTYFYVVTAVNSGGESSNSSEASATPQAASQLIGYVQSASAASAGPIAFPAPNNSGDTIIVAVASGNAPSSVLDTQGNVYQLIPGSSSGTVRVYVAKNIFGGSNSIMVNGITSWADTYIHEYAGLDPSAPVDQVSIVNGTGTAITTGWKPISSPNEVIFGFAAVGSGVSAAGTGFTLRQTADGNATYDEIVNAMGSYNAPATQVNASSFTAVMVTLQPPCTPPAVRLVQPRSLYIQSSSTLTVQASACIDPTQSGWGVRFILDQGTSGAVTAEIHASPYVVTFPTVAKGEHALDAYLVDASGNLVSGTLTHDSAQRVGIGDYYVSMGDSITQGNSSDGDNISSDDTSNDGRNTGGGYEPILNNLMTARKGYPQTVVNEGIGGTTSADGLSLLPTLLLKHPNAEMYLVDYGMNDARPWMPVPSGQGLNVGSPGYAGTYKDHMQQIINEVNGNGKRIALSKINVALADCNDNVPTDPGYCSPYPNPTTGARSLLIEQYNTVIDELRGITSNNITVVPPDLWNWSLNNYSTQYWDWIHPNGLGYQSIAGLWNGVLP